VTNGYIPVADFSLKIGLSKIDNCSLKENYISNAVESPFFGIFSLGKCQFSAN
jgi:hypothetical protein